jgi:hypothetical protein
MHMGVYTGHGHELERKDSRNMVVRGGRGGKRREATSDAFAIFGKGCIELLALCLFLPA